jgi:hypothetical protein
MRGAGRDGLTRRHSVHVECPAVDEPVHSHERQWNPSHWRGRRGLELVGRQALWHLVSRTLLAGQPQRREHERRTLRHWRGFAHHAGVADGVGRERKALQLNLHSSGLLREVQDHISTLTGRERQRTHGLRSSRAGGSATRE